jgi:hypothetical protein
MEHVETYGYFTPCSAGSLTGKLGSRPVFFEEQMLLIAKAKGGKSRYVPILAELAQALRTHVGQRTVG